MASDATSPPELKLLTVSKPSKALRGPGGRFLPGTAGGPGNPLAAHVHALRAALLSAVTPEELAVVCRTLLRQAQGGDVAAARLLFDRLLGPAQELDLLEQLETVQARLKAIESRATDTDNGSWGQ